MAQQQTENNEVLALSRLLQNGSLPLKLITETGAQKTGELFLAKGAVVANKNATVIFVCG